MSVIDFKEIPQANKSTGQQDTFELFARDFLEYLGYHVISTPGRGADDGADLIVEEIRRGIGGETQIKWLVSCKHFVHSGKSVSVNDEPDIHDRVKARSCDGFIGFYSTIPSSPLVRRLEGLQSEIEHQIFDSQKIEGHLLKSPEGYDLACRYFSSSISLWKQNNPTPVKIFSDNKGLRCKHCGADLLQNKANSNVIFWRKLVPLPNGSHSKHYIDIYWCCKGSCDEILGQIYRPKYLGYTSSWKDISDISIPTGYVFWVMSILNQFQSGCIYSDEAFSQIKTLLLEIFPHIARDLTESESKRVQMLMDIPTYFGGLSGMEE